MQKLLSHAAFITYASPLIGKYSLDLIEGSETPENILINNCFPEDEFEYRENNSPKIKFVWFSQNISAGRGLEVLVPALAKYKEQVELTLIGNLYPAFYNEFLAQYTDFIHIDKPLLQKDLNQKLSEFDVGLAIELKTSDFNRDICLTNKIFSYAQSGLFILATDTTAQKDFISTHGMLGIITGQSAKEMEVQIEEIIGTIHNLRNQKKERFDYAKKLSWENESEKLKELWNKFIVVP